ncbi:uncharacterized protein LOC141607515 [Silene latifolia]|uniref:uncharacterized protein LOC141607515 n=1 Tax=Silene latifolia TaxID=37657 RepID=UPI003D788C9F
MGLLRSFATFSAASGLQMNSSKGAFGSGALGKGKRIKWDDSVSGFSEGQLAFKYLGIPITCGRMLKADCQVLVEKLIQKIRSFGTKKLSYAGRLVLVNSVLTAIYSYWINIFIIPKGVLNRINSICRNYLWDENVDYIRVPMVSWERVCAPKSEGGLGIRDSYSWNVAAIGKLVWWVYYSPDRLWVTQWIMDPKGYTMGSGYDMLRQKFQPVSWHKIIWHQICIPKHKFICWMIAKRALMLKEKLFSLGIAPDDSCLLCGQDTESYEHLFQACVYSRQVLDELARLCQVLFPRSDLLEWIEGYQCSQLKKRVLICVVLAVYYHLWLQRNRAQVDGVLLRPAALCAQIMCEIRLQLATRIILPPDGIDGIVL